MVGSIWDDWVDTPSKVKDGATTEPGPDSYHRVPEDVSLAADLGLDRYRHRRSARRWLQ
ncbi:family 1 glycosylhydrolase [Galactobacter sp.]|uniref:family 1 glycosylhydrolase n=1 Tax=Galactobacter sp. TaxID=2676125 RepID=UPI0025B82961|nr:family 1 glycosylhydrolase [Galactobacter sp.]